MTFLAYLHLVVHSDHECLCCATQRRTAQAVQQHMLARGHCRFDLTKPESELRDFFDCSSISINGKGRLALDLTLRAQSVRPQRSKQSPRMSKLASRHLTVPASDGIPTAHVDRSSEHTPDSSNSPNAAGHSSSSHSVVELNSGASATEATFSTQLSRLRKADQQSLMHLPTSQQRALLSTQQKQTSNAQRREQMRRTRLESAGNLFGRLDTVRLVRQPPHFGQVSGLNR